MPGVTTPTTGNSGPPSSPPNGKGNTGAGPTDTSSTTSTTTVTYDPAQVAAMQAEAAAVPRTPPGSTLPLLVALAPLARDGLSPVQRALVGFGRFPVAGPASYTDDWLEFRPGPPPSLHPGIDIEAASGTPILSPADGTLTYSDSDPDGYGLAALVTQPDRTVFLMAHMSATVLGLSSGAPVKAGQVIGFVGATGNATGPHMHFEVHPYGGAGVDGKPFLDQWLAQALAAAPAVVARYDGQADSAVAVPAPPAPFVPEAAPRSLAASATLLGGPTGGRPADWMAALARASAVVGTALSGLAAVVWRRRRRSRTAG
ncbi:MAG TPA: M23 family metallopeptidase [Acidimicrobiales bacterium]|nr:M23 family metallopeptidase [Acidimicrobiales bacterium]